MSQLVAIVGRPNVGKSTLYNRMIGERYAIIDDVSGVTRDRIYGKTFWNGKNFSIVDTGGFVGASNDIFESEIRLQVKIAIEEATAIIFMTDVTTGITDLDEDIANLLRRAKKPVLLAVNKVDNNNRMLSANEFWSLGFEDTFFLSSITGSGTGELMDALVEVLPDENEEEIDDDTPKIAIVGQPNVGKSSLTNVLLDDTRNIVTDIAGTTRDSIHTKYNKFGKELYLIDTAGIRKKAKVFEDLEFYSVMRAIKAIEESDVCLLMIDATQGIESQDMHLIKVILNNKKGLVILVNKWDLVEKETNTAKEFEEKLKRKMMPFSDVPVLFISAKEKQRVFKVIELALDVYERRTTKIKTSELNRLMQESIEKIPPPSHRGLFIKIKYITQLPVYYPSFAFFCNYPDHVKDSYKQYLENQLRTHFNFTGVPISLSFRKK
jgi:GTP-binding protein